MFRGSNNCLIAPFALIHVWINLLGALGQKLLGPCWSPSSLFHYFLRLHVEPR